MRFSATLRRIAWRELKYALWLPVYLLLFAILERSITENYWATQLPIDQYIPFCEWFVVPYCLWYPLLVLTGLFLLVRDVPGFRRYMTFLSLTFFLSVAIWVLVPNGQDLRPLVMPRDNVFTRLIAALYRADTNTNVFPSVHVVGAIGAAWALWDTPTLRDHPGIRWAHVILAALICGATLLIKQHSVLDVLSGSFLSLAVGLPLYRHSPAVSFRKLPEG